MESFLVEGKLGLQKERTKICQDFLRCLYWERQRRCEFSREHGGGIFLQNVVTSL